MKPDYVCDAWQIEPLVEKALSKRPFGFIFFAHVGSAPPFESSELQSSLEIYCRILQPNGVLVFNSEVFLHSDAPDFLAKQHSQNSFSEWKEAWILAISHAGFQDIEIMVKPEPVFGPECVSILLVARKS